jgi:hypothetical protein
MATFSSFEDAWGASPAPDVAHTQAPMKSFAAGNSPQKSMANGAPQKVYSTGEPADQRDMVLASMMEHSQKQSKEILRLERMVGSLVQENNANRAAAAAKPRATMSVMEITMIVLALVFIVLVLYLISLVRSRL